MVLTIYTGPLRQPTNRNAQTGIVGMRRKARVDFVDTARTPVGSLAVTVYCLRHGDHRQRNWPIPYPYRTPYGPL
jgi:hypothetical protein